MNFHRTVVSGVLPILLGTVLLPAQQPGGVRPVPASLAAPAGVTIDHPEPDQPTRWIRGETYKASVDGGAFTYIPFLGADAERNFPIRFELHSVALGGQVLDIAAGEVAHGGTRLSVHRRSVTEVYDVAPREVEQSFVFDRLDARGGDLEIVLSVTSELDGGSDGADVAFIHARGRVDYRHLVAVDARGERLVLPIRWQAGRITLAVPAAFVATAQLPLIVDPVLTTTTVATTADFRTEPQVAWNEAVDENLVVWQVPFSATDQDVAAVRTDFWMNPIGSVFWIDSTADQWLGARVACKSREGMFLVVGQVNGATTGGYAIKGRRYEAFGGQRVLWGTFPINQPNLGGFLPGNSYAPDVGADPWSGGTTYFAVVWEYRAPGGNGDIVYRLIDANGAFQPGSVNPLNLGPYDDHAPSISKSAGIGMFGVTWTQYGSPSNTADIVAAVLYYDGTVLRQPWYLDASPNQDTRPRVSTVARQPGQHVLLFAWQRNYDPFAPVNPGRMHCATVAYDPLTATFGQRTFDLTAALGVPAGLVSSAPVVDSDGLRFVVAHTEESASRSDTRISTLAPDGAVLRVHEGRAALLTSGASAFAPALMGRAGGGLESTRTYSVVCSAGTAVAGFVYNGHQAGLQFSTRAGGCGSITLAYGGYPVIGHSVDLAVSGSDPFKAIAIGFPTPMAQLGGCVGCTWGITGGTTVASPYSLAVPYIPTLVGMTLSAQGFTIGTGGPCIGQVKLTGAVDFTVR